MLSSVTRSESMTKIECDMVSEMATRLIAFINWKGADFESKKKKVLMELYQIKSYCRSQTKYERKG